MLARSQFFTTRANPKPVVSIFFFSCCNLAYKSVFFPGNFIIESAYTPSTNHSLNVFQSKKKFKSFQLSLRGLKKKLHP